MANLVAIWNGLTIARKAMLIGVLAATLSAFAMTISFASKPRMTLLYAGLDPSVAGEILTALEGIDTPAQVRGDAIYVPANKRDQTRLVLAQRGLPQQGQPGFEILDEMNGFATTSEMFDAAYWRAKEGELARTILATPGVKAARVHIAAPKMSSFARNRRSARASVTVTTTGGALDVRHATAIRFLVALAVPELEAEQVVVIDSTSGIILKPGAPSPEMPVDSGSEGERIARLESNLLDLLEARVGVGNARVNVALEVVRARETISENILDPDTRVLINRDVVETQEAEAGGSSNVTVASNLPDGDAATQGTPNQSQRSETREIAQYRMSEVQRQREVLPGAVAKINVAVLISEPVDPDTGETAPRSPDEVEALRDLVQAAIGYDENRGDTVTVRSMPFHQEELTGGVEVEESAVDFLKDNLMSILQILIPGIVVLVLALFVIKPVLTKTEIAELVPASAGLVEVVSDEPDSPVAMSPVEELRHLAGDNPEVSKTILKAWLGDTEQAA